MEPCSTQKDGHVQVLHAGTCSQGNHKTSGGNGQGKDHIYQDSMVYRVIGLLVVQERNCRTAKSSAIFDKAGVSEMGLMCLDTFMLGFCFGKGVTSAYFHDWRSSFSTDEQLKIEQIVLARKSAHSFYISFSADQNSSRLEFCLATQCKDTHCVL